jgi:hypothetical protein
MADKPWTMPEDLKIPQSCDYRPIEPRPDFYIVMPCGAYFIANGELFVTPVDESGKPTFMDNETGPVEAVTDADPRVKAILIELGQLNQQIFDEV